MKITKPASSRDIRAAAAGAIGKDRAVYRFTTIGYWYGKSIVWVPDWRFGILKMALFSHEL